MANLGRVPKITVPLFESGEVVFCQNIAEWNHVHRRLGADAGDGITNGASHTLHSDKGTLREMLSPAYTTRVSDLPLAMVY